MFDGAVAAYAIVGTQREVALEDAVDLLGLDARPLVVDLSVRRCRPMTRQR